MPKLFGESKGTTVRRPINVRNFPPRFSESNERGKEATRDTKPSNCADLLFQPSLEIMPGCYDALFGEADRLMAGYKVNIHERLLAVSAARSRPAGHRV